MHSFRPDVGFKWFSVLISPSRSDDDAVKCSSFVNDVVSDVTFYVIDVMILVITMTV